MPHIIVKLYEGKSDALKKELAQKIVKDVVKVTECREAAVSVAFEEFTPDDWPEQVFRPDIMEGKGELLVSPGYDPFATAQTPAKDPAEALMAFVREAAETAAAEDETGYFNPMSWLDETLEDNPQMFDPCFDTPWNDLTDADKTERMTAIRRVL
ncbi:MAG TPA: 4-oxalocrotonate tautomerase [Desulfobacteraceae bacterium]|nr:4-oxalocrotonate tautomerase [Desulfobacteraceae bacterium]